MKLKSFLAAFLLLFCSTSLWASDSSVGGIWYDFYSSTLTARVTYRGSSPTSYADEYSGSITIPSSVSYFGKTYSVTSIGGDAFRDCSGLTSVEIPNSVTSIGNYAFANCSGLTSVEIPNSVTSIGNYAFANCSGLTSVEIPNSVTSIGNYAFANCSGLTSVEIPNSVTSIGNYAFANCSGLTSVEIPNGVTSIGDYAFEDCTGLTSMTIPNSVTSIGNYVFKNCIGLTNVTIGNSLTTIGNSPFYGCSGLTMTLNSNSMVGKTYSYQSNLLDLFGYPQVTKIIIGDEVTSIGRCAFWGCSSLTSVIIGNSVTSIGNSAFFGCSNLTSIEIPSSVTSIGQSSFSACSGLTSIVVGNGNSVYDSRNNCNAIINTATNILVVGCQNTIIPNSVTSIGNTAFECCRSLTSIDIPSSVTSIGNSAFEECSLISVTIPNSVTSIGAYAFCACSGLTSVTMQCQTPPTGYDIFYKSNKLSDIYVPCGMLETYQTQWSKYSSIIKYLPLTYTVTGKVNNQDAGIVTVPTNICEQLFATSNYGYHFVQWSDGVTDNPRIVELTQDTTFTAEFDLDRSGKCGNDSLLTWEYDTIAKALSITGDGPFVDNIQCGIEARPIVEHVIIGSGITAINSNAFVDCPKLNAVTWNAQNGGDCTSNPFPSTVTSFTIAEGVDHIPAYLCAGMTKLASINLPNSITSIGESAFRDCSKMKEIIIPDNVANIGSSAFAGCTMAQKLSLDENLTNIGDSAFAHCPYLLEVKAKMALPPVINASVFSSCGDLAGITCYIPQGFLTYYQKLDVWKEFNLIESTFEEKDAIENTHIDTSVVPNKEIINSQLFILLPDGSKYSAMGVKVE